VALTIVVSLKTVGAILIFALLLIPAATAYQLTSSLHRMMAYSVAIGVLVSVAGVLLSCQFDLPTGPAIVLLATGVFFVAVALSPKRAPKPALSWSASRIAFTERFLPSGPCSFVSRHSCPPIGVAGCRSSRRLGCTTRPLWPANHPRTAPVRTRLPGHCRPAARCPATSARRSRWSRSVRSARNTDHCRDDRAWPCRTCPPPAPPIRR